MACYIRHYKKMIKVNGKNLNRPKKILKQNVQYVEVRRSKISMLTGTVITVAGFLGEMRLNLKNLEE